jgi:hypothetical protein
MKNRLKALLCNVVCRGDDRREGGCGLRKDDRCDRIEKLDMCMIECITDHLLAEGVIVPPCKVGDKVFVLSQGAGFSVVWNVYESIVKAVHLDKLGQLFVRVETDRENVGGYVEIERVFLTREEAEKALAERSGQ